MKTVIFIGSQKSGSSREAIYAADRLGFYTVLLTDRESFLLKREQFPDVHLMIKADLNNIDEMKEKIYELTIKGIKVDAILSLIDPYCFTACELAKEFNVLNFTDTAIDIMDDKIKSKKAISKTPHCMYFKELSKGSRIPKKQIEAELPLILKSPLSTGSKDVYKVDTYIDFKQKYNKIINKYPDQSLLVESYIGGTQYIVETIMYQGEMYIVAIIEQEITYINEHFIVTGYSLLLEYDEVFYNNLKNAVKTIINSHGMLTGTCHLEMRYFNERWILIEINPRMSGGGMNQLIIQGFGINLAEETVKLALGIKPDLKYAKRIQVYAKYIVLNEKGVLVKVTGKNRAKKCTGVEVVYVKPRKGASLNPPLSMGDRYAYVIASGENALLAKQNAEYAANLIHFVLSDDTKNLTEEVMK